jgi:serine/threonine protein phosphatase PrpC
VEDDEKTVPVDTQHHPESGQEEDRSLLMSLTEAELLSKIEEGGLKGRKFSIGSETDKALHRSNSFSSKTTNYNGDVNLCVSNESIGYACKKGLKPEAPNQDSFFICKVEGHFSMYGVFDGHGRKGHDVSNFVKDMLPKVLLSDAHVLDDPSVSLSEAFEVTQRLIEQATSMEKLDANRSGSTASMILYDYKKRMLYTAHVGDSRCVLAKQVESANGTTNGAGDKKVYVAVDLTEDHKPNLPAEKARIERLGGQVRFDGGFNYRVYAKGKRYPGLNMSRAMGDLLGFHDAGISACPDVAERPIVHQETNPPPEKNETGVTGLNTPTSPKSPTTKSPIKASSNAEPSPAENGAGSRRPSVCSSGSAGSSHAPSVASHPIDPMSDKFVLICSDGVWEFMTSDEAVQLVSQFNPSEAMSAAEHLASAAWDRWMHHMKGEVVDDITAIVMFLDPQRQG